MRGHGILARILRTRTYQELSGSRARVAWLTTELQTRRPLIGAELPFSDKTELIETFRVVRSLQQSFGPNICANTLSA